MSNLQGGFCYVRISHRSNEARTEIRQVKEPSRHHSYANSSGTTQKSRRKRQRLNDGLTPDHQCDDSIDQSQVAGSGRNSRPDPSSFRRDDRESPSQDNARDPDSSQPASLHAHSLSFILHPSHEVCTPEECNEEDIQTHHSPEEPLAISKTCYALGISPDGLKHLLSLYFENMTSFVLFHEPTFDQKLQQIPSFTQLNALLAAMFTFSAQLGPLNSSHLPRSLQGGSMATCHQHFGKLAHKFAQEALDDCGDGVPTLCLLQAFIIITHQELTRGVRGKAWRLLGLCVRMAYEMNLHLIDSSGSGDVAPKAATSFCQDEERRRAWWAIWEMDVFASTVRRCPTAINWAQNETHLPASDEDWYLTRPQTGCFLQPSMTKRWKVLESTRNRSCKAWFIVVNSLMRDAQTISSPKGVYRSYEKAMVAPDRDKLSARDAHDDLAALSDTLRCLCLALPEEFKYRNQHLSFQSRMGSQHLSLRHHHAGITSIHLLVQLAWLMIHHCHVFESPGIFLPRGGSYQANELDESVIEQYFGAADKIVAIIQSSCDDHFKYINPFLASTVWMAAAVQLVRLEFGLADTNKMLVKNKFDLLCGTYKQMVNMWNISTALQQNLELIATRLQQLRRDHYGLEHRSLRRTTIHSNANTNYISQCNLQSTTREDRSDQVQDVRQADISHRFTPISAAKSLNSNGQLAPTEQNTHPQTNNSNTVGNAIQTQAYTGFLSPTATSLSTTASSSQFDSDLQMALSQNHDLSSLLLAQHPNVIPSGHDGDGFGFSIGVRDDFETSSILNDLFSGLGHVGF